MPTAVFGTAYHSHNCKHVFPAVNSARASGLQNRLFKHSTGTFGVQQTRSVKQQYASRSRQTLETRADITSKAGLNQATRNSEGNASLLAAAAHDQSKHESESEAPVVHQAVPASSNPVVRFVQAQGATRVSLFGATVFLVGTLILTGFRIVRKYNAPQNKRKRNVSKNKLVVESLQDYLPHNRAALTPGVTRSLKMKTGFNAAEIFRKYLWYLLRERKFDTEAVSDVVQLKTSLQLSDEEVAEAIRERAKRIYDKYGNVMLDVKGMTKAGVERKATCRALFSKLLYLAEYDGLLPQDTELAQKTSVPDIFGATSDDTAGLRIVSLHEVDFDKLEGQFDAEDTEEGSDAR